MHKQLRSFILNTERDVVKYGQQQISATEFIARLLNRIAITKGMNCDKQKVKKKKVKVSGQPSGVMLPLGRGVEPFLIRSGAKNPPARVENSSKPEKEPGSRT